MDSVNSREKPIYWTINRGGGVHGWTDRELREREPLDTFVQDSFARIGREARNQAEGLDASGRHRGRSPEDYI